jgi:hypothetical protein
MATTSRTRLFGRRLSRDDIRLARLRKLKGIALLNALCWPTRPAAWQLGDTSRLRPYRRKPNTPPMRPDPVARHRRRRRKIAHESRRRNRA